MSPAASMAVPKASPVAHAGNGLDPLLSGTARRAVLERLAEYRDWTRSFYLECRLGPYDGSRVDMLLSLQRSGGGAPRSTAPSGARHPVVERLFTHWSDSTSALSRVPVAWLEFDRLDTRSSAEPNVCVCVQPAYSSKPFAPLAPDDPERTMPIIRDTLRVVGERVPRAEMQTLERLVRGLPAGAGFIHFSTMWTRRPRELKLYGAFPRSALPAYLKAHGWAGDLELLAQVLERYCPHDRTNGTLYVDLPILGMHDRERATLGISFSQQHLRLSSERDPRRAALLSELCAARVCSRERVRAVETWLDGGATDTRPRRWLDIKLVLTPARSVQAKAYLGVAGRDLA